MAHLCILQAAKLKKDTAAEKLRIKLKKKADAEAAEGSPDGNENTHVSF